jgi:hypothetical protein
MLGAVARVAPCAARHAANDRKKIDGCSKSGSAVPEGRLAPRFQSVGQSEARNFCLAKRRFLLNPPCSKASFVETRILISVLFKKANPSQMVTKAALSLDLNDFEHARGAAYLIC